MTSRQSYFNTIGAGKYQNKTVVLTCNEINDRVEKAFAELKAKIAEKEAAKEEKAVEETITEETIIEETAVETTSKITNIRKSVATLANRINKKLKDLSKSFRKAWAIVKGRIQSKISGVSFGRSQEALRRLTRYNPAMVNVELVREANNQYDSNAVSVNVSVDSSKGYKLGYLPKDLAAYMANLINNGVKLTASFRGVTGGMTDTYYGALIEIQF